MRSNQREREIDQREVPLLPYHADEPLPQVLYVLRRERDLLSLFLGVFLGGDVVLLEIGLLNGNNLVTEREREREREMGRER